MLWVDKHRPRALEKLDYHQALSKKLKAVAETGDVPHLLFYGPSGAGKKTRVLGLLRSLYGPGAEKVRLEQRTFKTPTNRQIEFSTLGSNFHIEMNPSDTGIYDRFVVQEVIKEIAQYHPLDTQAKKQFKVVVLSDAHLLTKDAQHALRRTMEKYVSSCRIILCCESLGRIIDPLRSRCLCLRVGAPTAEEICGILTATCAKEGLDLPAALASRIAKSSQRNLRRALLTVEACKVAQYPFTPDQEIVAPDWELFIQSMATKILVNQNPKTVLDVRQQLYELLANCIPADMILRELASKLQAKLDDDLKSEVARWAAHYDLRLKQGQKAIYHLEAFVIKFMTILKRYYMELLG